jgi:hypothetical protein
MVPTWLEEKPKEKSSMLEESRIETSRNQEKAGVASKRIGLMDLVVRLQHAWYASCRMSSWLQLIKLCRKRRPQILMRMSNLG